MKKTIKIIFLCSLGILFIFLMTNQKKEKTIFINDNPFNVELAETRMEKAKGLMGREDLSEESGILFVYKEEGIRSFWMKNMNFSIDIIWIDEEKTIISIEKSVPPCKEEKCPKYESPQKTMYVLEINSGLSEELGIKEGDRLVF